MFLARIGRKYVGYMIFLGQAQVLFDLDPMYAKFAAGVTECSALESHIDTTTTLVIFW